MYMLVYIYLLMNAIIYNRFPILTIKRPLAMILVDYPYLIFLPASLPGLQLTTSSTN